MVSSHLLLRIQPASGDLLLRFVDISRSRCGVQETMRVNMAVWKAQLTYFPPNSVKFALLLPVRSWIAGLAPWLRVLLHLPRKGDASQ